MQTSLNLSKWLFSCALFIALLVAATLPSQAADPGAAFPASAASSDQKAGSLLVYNVYTSSTINFTSQNARLSLTNTSDSLGVAVHLFFVDGATCSVADSFLCLTANLSTGGKETRTKAFGSNKVPSWAARLKPQCPKTNFFVRRAITPILFCD